MLVSNGLSARNIGPVTVWSGHTHGKYPDGNQLLVQGTDSIAIFDTPLVSLDLDDELRRADLMILGHAHEDHMVGLKRFIDRPLFVHDADLSAVQSWPGLSAHYGYTSEALGPLGEKIVDRFHYCARPDAVGYPDGKRWDLGQVSVQAIHMPGHTRGHCVLMVEPDGIAFIGDIDLSSFGPYYGDACSSLADFRITLQRIATLPASCWITSHHKGVIESREVFLEQLAVFSAQLEARENRILELIARSPATIHSLALAGVMYRPGTVTEPWMVCAEERCISQHVQELIDSGRLRALDPGVFGPA